MDESLELLFISKEKNNVWYDSTIEHDINSEITEHVRFGDEPITHVLTNHFHRDVLITTDAKYYDKKIDPWYKTNYYIYADMNSYRELCSKIIDWCKKNVDKIINDKHYNLTIDITSCTLYKDFPIVVANPIDNETYDSLLKVVNSVISKWKK